MSVYFFMIVVCFCPQSVVAAHTVCLVVMIPVQSTSVSIASGVPLRAKYVRSAYRMIYETMSYVTGQPLVPARASPPPRLLQPLPKQHPLQRSTQRRWKSLPEQPLLQPPPPLVRLPTHLKKVNYFLFLDRHHLGLKEPLVLPRTLYKVLGITLQSGTYDCLYLKCDLMYVRLGNAKMR